MEIATRRRLADELNVNASLEFVYKFSHQSRFGSAGSENELCSVFLGHCDGEIVATRNEIEAIRFVDRETLAKELQIAASLLTPWFKMEWDRLNSDYSAMLARYAG
jgi:isopentenyl-diphosphate delta-isomerase